MGGIALCTVLGVTALSRARAPQPAPQAVYSSQALPGDPEPVSREPERVGTRTPVSNASMPLSRPEPITVISSSAAPVAVRPVVVRTYRAPVRRRVVTRRYVQRRAYYRRRPLKHSVAIVGGSAAGGAAIGALAGGGKGAGIGALAGGGAGLVYDRATHKKRVR